MKRGELNELQSDRLLRQAAYACERVPFYTESFAAAGLEPGDIRGLEDLERIPFTTKADIQERFPYGLCAVSPGEIARVHSSSGSTGPPVNTCYTRADLESWADCMANGLAVAGVTADDVCQIAFKYTLFTGAFGHHLGAEKLGATIIPTSSGNTERQIRMMQAFGTTVLHCTPSYAVVVAEKVEELGIDPATLPLRLGVHGAEPLAEGLRKELQERLRYRISRDYGLTELGGPGVSIECEAQEGYHVNEDQFLPEVVDPDTGDPLPDGEIGELVFTALRREGAPILRYRTRDLASLTREQCPCGRITVRHSPILGRTDDMLIVGGVNFFPVQVAAVLDEFPEISGHHMLRLGREGSRDTVEVRCELKTETFSAGAPQAAELAGRVEGRLREAIGFRMACSVLEPATLPRSEGKTRRVSDER